MTVNAQSQAGLKPLPVSQDFVDRILMQSGKILMAAAVGAAIGLSCTPAHTQALDPHAIYEQRCSRCHKPHAGPFARDKLTQRNGKLVSVKTGRDISRLLQNHYGTRLTQKESDAVVEMFSLQLQSGGLYRKKCIVCHERAKDLARRELQLVGGKLLGRYTGRDIAVFLKRHGRLTPDEVAIIHAMLLWQLKTKRRKTDLP